MKKTLSAAVICWAANLLFCGLCFAAIGEGHVIPRFELGIAFGELAVISTVLLVFWLACSRR